ncbi:MAG: hypothetical protein J3K34DRAFT_400518 [Monoraphidium minutum]|nr:MAG: hypothetical protein J3K34DRAFT_400518 [Monoraphidium minutum]
MAHAAVQPAHAATHFQLGAIGDPLPGGVALPMFPQLQELFGVNFTPECVSALARCASRLRVITSSVVEAGWAPGVRHASLPNVTHTFFFNCSAGCALPRVVNLQRLLPAAQELGFKLTVGDVFNCPALDGLTGLRALTVHSGNWEGAHVRNWDVLARMSGLTRLVCGLDSCDPVQLSQLVRLTALEELLIDLWPGDDGFEEDPLPVISFPMGALFDAAARMPRLHTLIASSSYAESGLKLDFGTLARFMCAPTALRRLELRTCTWPPLALVPALAAHPRLRRLVFSCGAIEAKTADELIAQAYATRDDCAVTGVKGDVELAWSELCSWFWD